MWMISSSNIPKIERVGEVSVMNISPFILFLSLLQQGFTSTYSDQLSLVSFAITVFS